MNTQLNSLPIIISEKVTFSCFLGFVSGTIEAIVNDQGTTEFPTVINVSTNLGGGSVPLLLKGNETIHKNVSGIDINVTISKWNCSTEKLSFHVKAVGTKTILVPVSCTVIDKTFSGERHNKDKFAS